MYFPNQTVEVAGACTSALWLVGKRLVSCPVLNHLSTCVWPLGNYLLPHLFHLRANHMFIVFFSEQETKCCGVYCCLLYTGHWSSGYSCHTRLSMTTLILLILFPLILVSFPPLCWFCCCLFKWTPVTFFCTFLCFPVSLYTLFALSLSSLSLCYIVHCTADIPHNKWGFKFCSCGHYMAMFSGFRVFVGGKGMKMFLLCIMIPTTVYLLSVHSRFIYEKIKYIIYILKYYYLVFEVGIARWYFSWVSLRPFIGCYCRHCLLSLVTVGCVISNVASHWLSLSFNIDDWLLA